MDVKWGQKQSKVVEMIQNTQNEVLQMLNFKGPQELVDNLYKESKFDKIKTHHNKS